MGKAYVPIYLDWLYTTQDLTPEEKGNLVDAMVSYASGLEYEHLLTGGCRIAFRFLKGQIDRNAAISESRSLAGSARKETPSGQPAPREAVCCRREAPAEPEPSEAEPRGSKNEQNETNENKTEQSKTKCTIKKEIKKEKEKEEKENFVKKREQKREKEQKAKERTEESFARFWSAYPRHEAKAEARKAFEKLDPDESLLTVLLEAIRRRKDTAQWKEGGGRFVPHPSTWLNQRRWEDEVPPAAPAYRPSGPDGYCGPKPVMAQMYSQRSYEDEDAEAMRRMMLLPDTEDEQDESPAAQLLNAV